MKTTILFLLGLILLNGAQASVSSEMNEPTERKIEELISKMTLQEKLGQMSQFDPGQLGEPEDARQAIKDGKVGSILNLVGAHEVNGVPASGNEFTLKQILRNEWNYKGMVVSDWASITEMIAHGYAANSKEAAEKALKAYKKVNLKPGESTEVSLTLAAKDLEFFNGTGYVIEPGDFDVWVGTNSVEGLHGEFSIK